MLAGLEVVETLNDAGIVTKRPLAVAFFTNEEGARFQPDMFGSLVFTGAMPLERALATVGIDGAVAGEELKRIGYAGKAPVGRPNVHAYVELHVEQGPTLEAEGFTIGAVEGVQGISWTEFTLTGQSNHAGTTPMRMRRDAGYVAAEIAAFARRLALELGGDQVATVGALTLSPNLVNVVAERAVMTVDLRNTDNARLNRGRAASRRFVAETAAAEGVTVEARTLARFDPVAFRAQLVAASRRSRKEFELPVKRLPSGAGHDAQMLAAVCPACMIFVPSAGGVSHNIEEYTKPGGSRRRRRRAAAARDRACGMRPAPPPPCFDGPPPPFRFAHGAEAPALFLPRRRRGGGPSERRWRGLRTGSCDDPPAHPQRADRQRRRADGRPIPATS